MPGPEAYRRGSSGFKLWGAVSIPAPESTTATTYAIGNLTTPDRVQNVVVPANGLIVVAYQALWQNTVTVNGRAAIFIGANQLKTPPGSGGGAPVAAGEPSGNSTINTDSTLSTQGYGLASGNATSNVTEVTTGEVMWANSTNFAGGPVWVWGVAAGTYDVSVQFKNNAAGTLTVSKRHLWVATIG